MGKGVDIIDAGKPEEIPVTNLAKHLEIVQLNEDVVKLGRIFTGKAYGKDIFLLDDSARKIIHYDIGGNLLGVLDNVGRSNKEYVDIMSYAYSSQDGLLYIYSNSTKSIKAYSVSDMSFSFEITVGYYLNAIELVSPDTIVAIKDSDNLSGGGIVSIDIQTGAISVIQSGFREDQYSYSDACSITRSKAGDVLICLCGYPNTVFSVSSESGEIVCQFVMDPSILDKRYWRGSYRPKKEYETAISRVMDEDAYVAPVFFSFTDQSYSFWPMTSRPAASNAFEMDLIVAGKSYKPLLPDGSLVNPIGVSTSGDYISLVRTEQIDNLLNEEIHSEHSLMLYSF